MYLLKALIHQEIEDQDIISEIFLITEKTFDKELTTYRPLANNCVEFIPFLTEEWYYVMVNYVINFGKKRILKGKMVTAYRDDLIQYLQAKEEEDDFRPLKIVTPAKNQIVNILEGGGIYLFELKKS